MRGRSGARLKELTARRSRLVYVLVRAARLNHRPFGAWAPLESDGTLVADDGAPPSVVEEFKAAGRDVVVVPTGRGPADAG